MYCLVYCQRLSFAILIRFLLYSIFLISLSSLPFYLHSNSIEIETRCVEKSNEIFKFDEFIFAPSALLSHVIHSIRAEELSDYSHVVRFL